MFLAYQLRFNIPESFFDLERPIFIIGVSRSGTTVFIDHFRRHSSLCDWSEAAQVMDLNFYDPDIDHLKSRDDVNPMDSFRIKFLFGSKTKIFRKKRFVNKHPENSLRMSYIKAIFPNAIFIHVIRDGYATVLSNIARRDNDQFRRQWPFGQFPKPEKWREYLDLPLLEQFSYQWADIVTEIRAVAKNSLSRNDYIEIRYEDFCERTHDELRRVDTLCELDHDGRLFDDVPTALDNQNFKWRAAWTDDQVMRVGEIIEPAREALGYPLHTATPQLKGAGNTRTSAA